jgi:hypothetical protein
MPQNLFAACRVGDDLIAKRVRLDLNVQQAVEAIFADQEGHFRNGITDEVDFDGSWKPDENEVLVMDIPQDAQIFVDTINANAVAVPDLDTAAFDQENIRALFTGATNNGATKVLIQQFSARQMLSRRFSLLQDGNAFRRMTDQAFALDNSLACIAEDGKLKFKSFHKMRAIVDLVDAYKVATDQEVQDFANHASFEVADHAAFLASADQISRKLMHAINRSGTLNNYTVPQIETAANAVGVGLTVNGGRIVMPADRAEVKKLLRFLDDGLYEAPLSGQRYVTNSKRPA